MPDLIDSLCELAKYRSRAGEPHRAERLYREALTHCAESTVPVHPALLFRINSLMAYHYDQSGRREDAVEHYESALRLAQRAPELEPVQVAVIHNNLGMLLKKEERFDDAETHYLEALRLFEETGNDDDPRLASVHNNLGVLHYSRHDFEKSRASHTAALNIRKRIYGAEGHHYDLGQTYNNLAAVHKAMGDYETASAFFAKVEALGDSITPLSQRAIDDEDDSASLQLDEAI
ncbi:MAG: tetratricopeptide repeat protein [Verrucomicrobiae bacterium]|nr:tetratricopeptide repeat protein [Verrucomicrobiae bacterium]